MSPPISGMTGFGRSEGQIGDTHWVWEVRSVNGRNLDVKFRTPQGLETLEARIREACAKRFKRGSVQVTLTTKRENAPFQPNLRINQDVLALYLETARQLCQDGQAGIPSADGLLALRGVVETCDVQEDDEQKTARERAFVDGLERALDMLLAARRNEGAALHGVFSDMFAQISRLTSEAHLAADAQVHAISEKITKRASELLGQTPYDEQRLLQEAAALALKSDVREELDRLRAHSEDGLKLLTFGGEIGRKLEFLAQEFQREANTLTTKAATIALTRLGLDLKALVDQLKEQAANVE